MKQAAATPKRLGLVSPQRALFEQALQLDCGRSLAQHELLFETYGALNAEASNAILICHALSGDHHAAGLHQDSDSKPGWWDHCIGPGKAIDTDRFFVVCPNNLGGCSGSTGPTSINPESGKAWGPDFPLVTVRDWVKSQAMLQAHLGINQWAAVIGGSLGGMQAMQWAIDRPEALRHAVIIAAAPRLSAQNIAFNEIARQAIRSDPEFHGGRYAEHGVLPERGLKLARMLGHITYLSDEAMRAKFGRLRRADAGSYNYEVEFEVESYLRHQGQQFVGRFDANAHCKTGFRRQVDPGLRGGRWPLTTAGVEQAGRFLKGCLSTATPPGYVDGAPNATAPEFAWPDCSGRNGLHPPPTHSHHRAAPAAAEPNSAIRG